MRRLSDNVLLLGGALLCVALVAGCHRGPKTPEEAFRKLELAVASGRPEALLECLSADTVRALRGAWQDERLARSLIEAKLPQSEKVGLLSGLTAAAQDDFGAYFAARAKEWASIERYRVRLGSVSGEIVQKAEGPSAMYLHRADGMPFHFTRSADGVWAFDEMFKISVLIQDQAAKTVQMLRGRIALLERTKK